MNTPRIELCSEDERPELEAFLVDRIYEFNGKRGLKAHLADGRCDEQYRVSVLAS